MVHIVLGDTWQVVLTNKCLLMVVQCYVFYYFRYLYSNYKTIKITEVHKIRK